MLQMITARVTVCFLASTKA